MRCIHCDKNAVIKAFDSEKLEFRHPYQDIKVLKYLDTFLYNHRYKSTVRYYIVYNEKNEPIMIAPLRIMREQAAVMETEAGFTFSGFASPKDKSLIGLCLEVLFSKLKRDGITKLDWNCLEEDDEIFPYIAASRGNSFLSQKQYSIENIIIPLDVKSYEEYYMRLSKSVRQNLRTAYNRIRSDGLEYKYECFIPEKGIRGDFNKIISLEYAKIIKRRHARRYSARVIQNNLHAYLSPAMKPMWNLEASMFHLRINGKIAAIMFGLFNNNMNRLEISHVAIDDEFRRYSLGMVLLNEMAKFCIDKDNNIEGIDLGRGHEKYKVDMGGQNYNTYRYLIEL